MDISIGSAVFLIADPCAQLTDTQTTLYVRHVGDAAKKTARSLKSNE